MYVAMFFAQNTRIDALCLIRVKSRGHILDAVIIHLMLVLVA